MSAKKKTRRRPAVVSAGLAMAGEALRQGSFLEAEHGQIQPDWKGAHKLLARRHLNAEECLEPMARAFRKRSLKTWEAAFGAYQLAADDRESADFQLVDSINRRIATRLQTEIDDAATRGSVDSDDVQDEVGLIAAEIINVIVDGLAELRSKVRPDEAAWSSRSLIMLDSTAGIEDERRAYMEAPLSAAERRCAEAFLAKRFPPQGMIFTTTAVGIDIAARHAGETDAQGIRSIECSSNLIVDVLKLIS